MIYNKHGGPKDRGQKRSYNQHNRLSLEISMHGQEGKKKKKQTKVSKSSRNSSFGAMCLGEAPMMLWQREERGRLILFIEQKS